MRWSKLCAGISHKIGNTWCTDQKPSHSVRVYWVVVDIGIVDCHMYSG
jgi:hypothetical protein